MSNPPAPPRTDPRVSLLRQRVTTRTALYFGAMVSEIESGYGCTRQQAASLLEIAKQKGFIIELQNFRLQIIDHGTDEI
mgnify:FL=1